MRNAIIVGLVAVAALLVALGAGRKIGLTFPSFTAHVGTFATPCMGAGTYADPCELRAPWGAKR